MSELSEGLSKIIPVSSISRPKVTRRQVLKFTAGTTVADLLRRVGLALPDTVASLQAASARDVIEDIEGNPIEVNRNYV